MNTLRYLISVSISEFEVMRDLGGLRVDALRMITTLSDRFSYYEVCEQVLSKLPAFRPNDDHSVLVLSFTEYRMEQILGGRHFTIAPGKVLFLARHCDQVIPLTDRARKLLSSRLGEQVVLAKPIFESTFDKYRERDKMISSYAGAEGILESLIQNHHCFTQGRLREHLEGDGGTFLRSVLEFTRNKPMSAEPISGLRDLGLWLIASPLFNDSKKPLVKELSMWIKPRQETTSGFQSVYRDLPLSKILENITKEWTLPISAASLAIFLHWRELAIRARGIDLGALELDCRELTGLDGQIVCDALWLLGFNAGFESISQACYDRFDQNHPLKARHKRGQRVTLQKHTRTPRKAPDPVSSKKASKEKPENTGVTKDELKKEREVITSTRETTPPAERNDAPEERDTMTSEEPTAKIAELTDEENQPASSSMNEPTEPYSVAHPDQPVIAKGSKKDAETVIAPKSDEKNPDEVVSKAPKQPPVSKTTKTVKKTSRKKAVRKKKEKPTPDDDLFAEGNTDS